MKDTVKEGIKGFSGNFSFGWFIVPALAVAPNKNGGTASAGYTSYSKLIKSHKIPTILFIPYLLNPVKSLQSCSSQTY